MTKAKHNKFQIFMYILIAILLILNIVLISEDYFFNLLDFTIKIILVLSNLAVLILLIIMSTLYAEKNKNTSIEKSDNK